MITTRNASVLLIFIVSAHSIAQQTPPIAPKIQTVPVPPAILLDAPPGQPKPLPLSIDEAVKIALSKQSAVAAARANVDAAAARTAQSRSVTLPNLALSGSYTNVNTFYLSPNTTASNANPGYAANLALSQLVYDFNVTRDQVRQNQATTRSLIHIVTKTEADTIVSTKQAFLNLIQAQQLVKVAEANLASRNSQFGLAKARLDRGLGAPPDVVRAQSNTDDATLQLVQARSNVTLAQINLAQIMGIDPRTPFDVTTPTNSLSVNEEFPTLVQQALDNRPEILSAKESLIAATLGENIARRSVLPTLSVNYTLTGRGDTDITSTQRGTFGIVLSWGIYDGGLASGKIKETRANEQFARQQIISQSQFVVADVSNAFIGFKTALQRIELSKSQITNAEEGVRLAEGRYKTGFGTFLEVTDAQAVLVQAQINQISAQIAARQQYALLARAIGKPMRD